MKPQEIKNLYPVTPELHESLCRTLNSLDVAAPARYKKRRSRRFIVAFAIMSALAAFTATACATDLFGLRAVRVGKYGLNMSVIEDASRPSEKKHVRFVIGYIPEGCELVDGSAESGKCRYTTGGAEYGADISIGFYLIDASDYNNEGRYVVESEEREINGHNAIIGAQQLEEKGEKYYFGVLYFENWDYIVQCSSNNRDELIKVMQGLDLEEDTDYTEPPTAAKDSDPHVPEDDYAYMMREDYRFVEIGEPFGYTEWIYNENGAQKSDAFNVTVKSIEERDSADGLDKAGFLYGERFSEWFDDDKLITPYLRRDYDFGGDEGLNEQITHTDTLTERHFMVVTVDVTAAADTESDGMPLNAWATPIIRKADNSYDFPTGHGQAFLMYQTPDNQLSIDWKKGDTRTYIFGILVDGEVLDRSCVTFESKQYTVDETQETVFHVDTRFCIMLKGGAEKR